jgi:hypothetical protein
MYRNLVLGPGDTGMKKSKFPLSRRLRSTGEKRKSKEVRKCHR